MIPILYEKTETTFTSNGLGRLTECTRCIVTEERNGVYEAEFDFPMTSPKYELIQEGRIIAATHDDNGDIQAFDIYRRTAPINGIVTFYARHISYRQIGIVVEPFTASGIANAIAGIKTNSHGVNPFTYSTDKTTAGEYKVQRPSSAKALLCGEENSLLDIFGSGEYEYDMFNVKLWTRRGTDTDVEIRYGKNLAEIENDVDYSETYNGVAPYWIGNAATPESESGDEDPEPVLIMLPEVAVMASGTTYDGRDTILPLDLSGEFQDPPTENELRTLATQKLNAADTLTPIENITVSFVQLWQTEEYANIAPLQKVGLCDTVHVIFTELGVDKTAVKVIKTVYNTLLDRYDEMELGQPLASYAAIITANNTSKIAQLEDGLLIVSSAATQAQTDADTARSAAISAQADAGDALIAAGNAVTAAGNASTAAGNAQSAADAAQLSADAAALQASTAGIYANSALSQIGIIQDVVGVLDLLSTNANYQLTADETVQPGKWYFTRSGYPGGTKTGSIVSFDTVAGTKASSVVADIDAAQDLHGYNAPWVGGAGKNVLNYDAWKTSSVINGTAVWNNNGVTLTATANDCYTQQTSFPVDARVPISEGETITLAWEETTNTAGAIYIFPNGSTTGLVSVNNFNSKKLSYTATSGVTYITFRFGVANSGNSISYKNIQIYRGTTAPASWTPYENICPISGHTDVVVSRTGVNVWDEEWELGGIDITTGQNTPSSTTIRSTNYIPVKGGETYRVYIGGSTTLWLAVLTYDADKNFLANAGGKVGGATFTLDSNVAYIRFYLTTTYGTTYNHDISINYPSTDTSYHAYEGDTYTIDLDGTRYGGTLDVTSGVLTVTHGYVADMGALGWYAGYGGYAVSISGIASGDNTEAFNMVCSAYPVVAYNNTIDKALSKIANGLQILIRDSSYANATALKTALNGQQLVYELATPLTFNLTEQEIELLAHNNIWANSGDITVIYPSTYSYAVVSNPDVSDIGTYYELVSIDAAVQDYLTSRIAVTSAGMWIQDPGMATKILLSSTDGVVLYGPNGSVIGKYGSTAQIGDEAGFHIIADGTELGFYQADRKVAYISNQQLYITQSVVLQQMDLGTTVNDGGLGQWSWKVHANGQTPSRNNLNLKWIG